MEQEGLTKDSIAFEEKKEVYTNQILATYFVSNATILRRARKRNKIPIDLAIHKGRSTTINRLLGKVLDKHILKLRNHIFGLIINDFTKHT